MLSSRGAQRPLSRYFLSGPSGNSERLNRSKEGRNDDNMQDVSNVILVKAL
jgi:hypothetical protein